MLKLWCNALASDGVSCLANTTTTTIVSNETRRRTAVFFTMTALEVYGCGVFSMVCLLYLIHCHSLAVGFFTHAVISLLAVDCIPCLAP